ncbi:YciI family protein [Croceivirga sp. JEA036]|uniref:YciI family protein n=1 Tax=Croceivirga sp. JEA036 TaxID=2721162 RepID=UPI001ADC8507|nr:YciI family protein [Croceivirga sp. JEA036]
MNNETLFMMLFKYQPDAVKLSSEEEETVANAWGQFIGTIALKEKLVSTHQLGQPLQYVGHTPNSGITSKEIIGGNMVIKANSMEEACALAQNSPILQLGGYVEVRTIIPMQD